jgi:hypothetical protein
MSDNRFPHKDPRERCAEDWDWESTQSKIKKRLGDGWIVKYGEGQGAINFLIVSSKKSTVRIEILHYNENLDRQDFPLVFKGTAFISKINVRQFYSDDPFRLFDVLLKWLEHYLEELSVLKINKSNFNSIVINACNLIST